MYINQVKGIMFDAMFKRKIVDWILSHQNTDGGFCYRLGLRSDVEATRFAIGVLQQLDKSASAIRSTKTWLNTIGSNRIRNNLYNYSLKYIYYWATASLAAGLQPLKEQDQRQFVLSLYRSNSTFASSKRMKTGDLDSALYAIRLLTQIDGKIPSRVLCTTYLFCSNCFCQTGGYALRPGKILI